MWNCISYIKEIIFWSLPFYFLHLYIKSVYHISLGQLVSWWAKNFSHTESSTAIIVSFILIFLLFCLPFTSLMNSFYLGLFGEKQTLVYLGNSSASNSMYYKEYDFKKSTFEGYNIDQSYNFSFKGVNKLKYFIKDPGTNNIVGQKNKRLHPTAILSTFFFMVFFLLPALGVIHALTYPMYIDLNGSNAYFHGAAGKAFEIVLLDFKITKGISVFILFGGLFMALFFSGKMPDEKDSLPITPIPSHIKPYENISGTPIEINILYDKKTNDDGSTTTYDSGYRNVIFKFDKGFKSSVYVTLNFDTKAYPELKEKIESNIASRIEMILVIDENLGLLPKRKY